MKTKIFILAEVDSEYAEEFKDDIERNHTMSEKLDEEIFVGTPFSVVSTATVTK